MPQLPSHVQLAYAFAFAYWSDKTGTTVQIYDKFMELDQLLQAYRECFVAGASKDQLGLLDQQISSLCTSLIFELLRGHLVDFCHLGDPHVRLDFDHGL